MSLYARPSLRLVGQIVADVFVVAWGTLWWRLGRLADGTIRALAGPAQDAARTASELKGQLADAATRAGDVPIVGENLRGPFEQMSSTVDGLATSASDQASSLQQLATIAGWAVFLAPLLIVLALWLPPRLAFIRRSSATRALARSPHGDELLALRALATCPVRDLTRAASDPVAAWRSGDPAALRRLADLQLEADGVARPRRARVPLLPPATHR